MPAGWPCSSRIPSAARRCRRRRSGRMRACTWRPTGPGRVWATDCRALGRTAGSRRRRLRRCDRREANRQDQRNGKPGGVEHKGVSDPTFGPSGNWQDFGLFRPSIRPFGCAHTPAQRALDCQYDPEHYNFGFGSCRVDWPRRATPGPVGSAHPVHATQRPERDPAPRYERAGGGGEPLVSRRVGTRARRPHRVCASLRARHVRRLDARARRLVRHAGSRPPAPTTTGRPPSIAPTTTSICRRTRSTWRCSSNRIAWASCSTTRRPTRSTASATW